MSSMKDPKELAKNPADASIEPADPPDSGRRPCGSDVPRLAVRCDGRVLLSTVDLQDVDLSKREVWVGLVLSEAEASDIHDRLNIEEAASPTVARLLALDKKAKARKPKSDDDDSNGDE